MRQFEDHLPVCRRASAQDHQAQSADHRVSDTVLSGAVSQYVVYTSGLHQFLPPVLLLSSAGSGGASTAVQLVAVAPSDANFTDGPDLNLTNNSVPVSIKQESDNGSRLSSNESRLSSNDAASDADKKDKMVNGVSKSNSVACDRVSEALLAAVDAQTESCATVADSQNSVDSVPSVAESPVTKPAYNTRRRRSMPSLPHTSEPALTALKRTTVRHKSSEQPPTKKTATETDNLPLFLSSMTDD